jgi:hypothetical protein
VKDPAKVRLFAICVRCVPRIIAYVIVFVIIISFSVDVDVL